MDLRKGWETLKARLRGWYSAVFGGDVSEDVSTTEEADVQTPVPEDATQEKAGEGTVANITEAAVKETSETTGEPVSVISARLEHLRRKRMFTVRKKSGRMEWQMAPADFTKAYLFLLAIPGADINRLWHRTVADNITYRLVLSDGTVAELTDNTRQADTTAVLRLIANGRCVLKINFINNIQN